MTRFFRFPHTPHLAWLSDGKPRDDKVLSSDEAHSLLRDEVDIEEKLDGANLGLSLSDEGSICIQNRGQYLTEPYSGQFARLKNWMAQHQDVLAAELTPDLIFFGEWCAAKHSLTYTSLPDWFLLFDVYDRTHGKFWSVNRRNNLAHKMEISCVPSVLCGHATLSSITDILASRQSSFRPGPMEGVVIRKNSTDWCETRAKLVRPDFVQSIDEHWRRRQIEWNRINQFSVGEKKG